MYVGGYIHAMKITGQFKTTLSQNFTLTPHVLQSLKILEMNKTELAHFIDQELLNNPLLERLEYAEHCSLNQQRHTKSLEADGQKNSSIGVQGEDARAHTSCYFGHFDYNISNNEARFSGKLNALSNTDNSLEDTVAARISLSELIDEQIIFSCRDPIDRFIARQITESLDDVGYLVEPVADIASRLRVDEGRIYSVLSKLQQFDPPGIFARNLPECLAIQLKRRGEFDWQMELLLANLPYLAKKDFSHLTRVCRCKKSTIFKMWSKISNLNPKPAELNDQHDIFSINPDIVVIPFKTGGFHIEISNTGLPAIFLNNLYSPELCKNTEERRFLANCQQTAQWLLKAIDQRTKTLLAVTTAIVNLQQPFFSLGPNHLRPLTLKIVSDAISMHESTVSRVTRNKYIATVFGTIPMRQLFSTALPSNDGISDHSTHVVRQYIKHLIAAETPENILCDDDLVKLLAKQNIHVARRTVAKYRDMLRIPSSTVRRRMQRMKLHNF